MTTLRERIGIDLGGQRRLEEGLEWTAADGVPDVNPCREGAPDHRSTTCSPGTNTW